MRWRRELAKMGALWRRRPADDLAEEIRAHLAMEEQEYLEIGLEPADAHYAALRRFGNIVLAEERSREMWSWNWVETLRQDFRYGLRQLRSNASLSAVVVLTLALGIGANTAVYSLVDSILVRPLPYRSPERLAVVSESVPQMGYHNEIGMAAGEYLDYRDRNRSFVETAAYENDQFNLTGAVTPLRVNAAAVTASMFPLLGVSPQLGHGFTIDDERQGSAPVTVLSYSLWRRQYGLDPRILGKAVKLNERPYLVIGVMPPSFQFPADGAPLSERVDLWVPEVFAPDRVQDRLREFGVGFIGRLKQGVSLQQAQADAINIADGFMQQYQYTGTLRVVPHVHRFSAYAVQEARPLVMLLLAAVACVLIIACANVSNLLLARSSHRSHEMAVRSAIGAGRQRLLRQCLAESLLLSLLGASAGLALALALIRGIRAFGPADVPRLQEIALDPPVLVFTIVISLFATVLFGLTPAWRLSQTSPQDCLKQTSRTGQARATHRLQSFIIVVEMAMALVLLIGGGLVLRSFIRVLNVPAGFRPKNLFIVRTVFDQARYPDPVKRAGVQKSLIEGLRHLLGVEVVAAASHLPLSDSRQIGFRLEHAAPDDFHWAENSLISSGYFRAMGIPILRGRDFTEQDRPDSPPVAVINEALARGYFPREDPLGKRFYWGDRVLFTIVAIAGDVHVSALDADPPPMIYISMFQVQSGGSERTALLLRLGAGRQRGEGLLSEVQRQIWSLDRELPVYDFTTFEALISESVAQRRFTTVLMLAFALIAVVLALVGLFGVISYLVAQRQRELAIRMALGASRVEVYWAVMKRGAALALAGCGAGFVLLPLGRRVLAAMLFQTSTNDPITLFSVPALLVGVALLASFLPARRAAKIDPVSSLRHE
jgi:predicted permease